ncbi:hypothetical protein [Nostoc sp.]|uniref:hypothetical protein n=1 Tax=Nostoc sp. TaxID=1180 RepID=UPI002FF9D946
MYTALTAAMRYIPKSESFDRRGQGEKLYCIIAGSAVIVPVVISAIIGSLWAIVYLLYSQNIQVTLKLFFYSFSGGFLGVIVGGFIGYLVGSRVAEGFSADFFISSEGFSWLLWISIFWIIGIIVGAVLGGLIFIRFYS